MLPADEQPRPIVIDTKLRTPKSAKLMKNYRSGVMPQPVILTGTLDAAPHRSEDVATIARRADLEKAGSRVEEVEIDSEL